MRSPSGYLYLSDPDAPPIERDTVTCGHCQAVVQVKPGSGATVYLLPISHPGHAEGHWHYAEEAGAFCRVCMRPICLTCHAAGVCRTWERWFDQLESRDRFLRQVLDG